jgi:hypothetical protein
MKNNFDLRKFLAENRTFAKEETLQEKYTFSDANDYEDLRPLVAPFAKDVAQKLFSNASKDENSPLRGRDVSNAAYAMALELMDALEALSNRE